MDNIDSDDDFLFDLLLSQGYSHRKAYHLWFSLQVPLIPEGCNSETESDSRNLFPLSLTGPDDTLQTKLPAPGETIPDLDLQTYLGRGK